MNRMTEQTARSSTDWEAFRTGAAPDSPAAKSSAKSNLLWLALVAFFLVSNAQDGVASAVLLLLAVAFHEAGHALAMKLFGFRDVRIFMIPFFDGIATGTKPNAPGWQIAAMRLAGPLPGIFLAATVAFFLPREVTVIAPASIPHWLVIASDAVKMFAFINAFNLLPMMPLDGGRVFETLLRGRSTWVFALYSFASLALCAGWAWRLEAWLLLAIGVLGLLGLPQKIRMEAAARKLRRHRQWPVEFERLSVKQLRLLDYVNRRANPQIDPSTRANLARQLFENVVFRPLSIWQAAFVLLAYVLSFVVAIAFLPKLTVVQNFPKP